MIGTRFKENQRRALDYMFRRMNAYGIMFDIIWEVACEAVESGEINEQMQMLENTTTRREQRSINAALRNSGFDQQLEYDTTTNWYEVIE